MVQKTCCDPKKANQKFTTISNFSERKKLHTTISKSLATSSDALSVCYASFHRLFDTFSEMEELPQQNILNDATLQQKWCKMCSKLIFQGICKFVNNTKNI